MGENDDLERTLLATLVRDKLPEILGSGGSGGEITRIADNLNKLIREFDVMRTSTEHKLEAHDKFGVKIRQLFTRIEEIADAARESRGKAAAEADAARDGVYAAVVELMQKSFEFRDGEAKKVIEARDREIESLREERDVLLKKVNERLDEHSGKFLPVQEGLDGVKWFLFYRKWIVGGCITIILAAGALAGAFLKLKEAFGT